MGTCCIAQGAQLRALCIFFWPRSCRYLWIPTVRLRRLHMSPLVLTEIPKGQCHYPISHRGILRPSGVEWLVSRWQRQALDSGYLAPKLELFLCYMLLPFQEKKNLATKNPGDGNRAWVWMSRMEQEMTCSKCLAYCKRWLFSLNR